MAWLAGAVAILTAAHVRAASPQLDLILPRGITRGTEIVLSFHGARLSDTREVLLYYPGIKVSKVQVANDGQVKVSAKIAPDCRLGEHAMRLRTASGISELRTFFVGALPTIDEKEPNNDFATAQKIPLNVTVNGTIDSEDVDYFVVDAKKGQRLTVEVEGMRLATTMFDPYVAILDARRFELVASDDSPLLGQDAVASVIVPADGRYFVQVRDSAYGGNGSCHYRLHVGTFPRPLGLLPAGGRPGEDLKVRFLGDVAGEFLQTVHVAAGPSRTFGLWAQDKEGIAPSPNPFRRSDLPNVIATDKNRTPETTPNVTLPVALNGVISKAHEINYFRFTAKAGQVYDITCYARRLGSPLDSVLYVAPWGAAAIVANDDAFGPDSYIRFQAPESRDYALLITDHLGKGGPTYFYRLEITTPKPHISVTIPKVALYSQERQTIPVPRGNRYATLVQATRADCGGDLVIGSPDLPGGVTMHSEPMPANLDTVPVVFEAAADAACAGKLCRLTAKPTDPKQTIESDFSQVAELVVAPPNQSVYWRHEVDRAAIAVTDEVPFKVQLVEPRVPLVQNGSLALKVVAERKSGFTAPIAVYPLFNPPGISTGVATITEKQTEAWIPVSAAANAQVRKWQVAVIANAVISSGPVWVSSQLITLEVAAPYLTLAMDRAVGEHGKSTELVCRIQPNAPFSGKATVRVLGLPPHVTAPEMSITSDTKEFAVPVKIDRTAPTGVHRNIFCQVVIMQNRESIVHNVGGMELRIDPAPAGMSAAPVAAKPVSPSPAAKRLTRLEQLRQDQATHDRAAH
jgi:hypothetical protein